MKKLLLAAALAVSAVALADRTDVWLASTVSVYHVSLDLLPDGGCVVTAFASITKTDGGVTTEGSSPTEVAGANRTTCLDILNNKAPVLFKTDKGL